LLKFPCNVKGLPRTDDVGPEGEEIWAMRFMPRQ